MFLTLNIASLDIISKAVEKLQNAEDINLYIIIAVFIIAAAGIAALSKSNKGFSEWFSNVMKVLKGLVSKKEPLDDEALNEIIGAAGYAYDERQDVFYSTINAWQRRMGYCRLYDEAAAPLSMIIDCEPIYFEYDGRRWMIEFWKGQYGMTCGCEIGVYYTKDPDLNIPGVFNGTFYNCAGDEDLLHMSCALERDGKVIFRRKGRHWWLTGFKLGEFSEPWELSMTLSIILKDRAMRNAFVEGLIKAGYSRKEIAVFGNKVGLRFHKPRTKQPYTRISQIDNITQRKNRLLCETYQAITSSYDNLPDKLKAVQQQSPELYSHIANMGKTRQLFKAYNIIKNYIK